MKDDMTMDLPTAEFYLGLSPEIRPLFITQYGYFKRNPRRALSDWKNAGMPPLDKPLAEAACFECCPDHPVCQIFR